MAIVAAPEHERPRAQTGAFFTVTHGVKAAQDADALLQASAAAMGVWRLSARMSRTSQLNWLAGNAPR